MNLKALGLKLRGNVSIWVPPSLTVVTTYVLLEQEAWFEEEAEFIRHCVVAGDRAIDVGANLGVYTLPLAEAVGPTGRVIAFEPTATTAAYLRATMDLRHGSRVSVEQAALSDREGVAQLHAGVSPEMNALAHAGEEASMGETVRLTTLDQYVAAHDGPQISFLKIDAEGHELNVAAGAKATLIEHEPLILFEIRIGAGVDLGLIDFLEPLGFSMYRLCVGAGALIPFSRNTPSDRFQINLFACTKRRADLLRARGILLDVLEPTCAAVGYNEGTIAAKTIFLPSRNKQPLDHTYAAALAHYDHAARATNSGEKHAHLLQALHYATIARNDRLSAARGLTYAQIARALGLRATAVATMLEIAQTWVNQANPTVDEPCLWPGEHSTGVGEREETRLKGAALEAFERWRVFSSFYTGSKALPLIEHICSLAGCTAEMHRRRQLLRMLYSEAPVPRPHPMLLVETPDNLNAWFWRANSGGAA